MIEDGRAGINAECGIDRYDGFGHSAATRTVVRLPRVPRYHFTAVLAKNLNSRQHRGRGSGSGPVGREAFSDVEKPFYTACDHMLGLTCQRLGSIGQTGVMVHRDGSGMDGRRPSRPSGPRIGEDGLGEKSS